MIEHEAIKWLAELDHYPTVKEFQDKWYEGLLKDLIRGGDVIIDDYTVILTAVTSAKQQKLIDESVRIR